MAVPLVARVWDQVRARYPDCSPAGLARELVRAQIGVMVNDLLAETRARIAASGVGSVADVRAADRPLVAFSDGMRADERTLKRFMYANLYHHPRQLAAAEAAGTVVTGLFACYRADPQALPAEWRERLPGDEPAPASHTEVGAGGSTGGANAADLLAYVQANYRDPSLTAALVAERFGMSRAGISRAFAQACPNGGFLGYLHGLRLDKAEELLRTTQLPIPDIASSVGYGSALTMTRAFKRYRDTTPGAFRKGGEQ